MPDAIRSAATLPGSFYHDAGLYTDSLEKVFAASWQWLGHTNDFSADMHYPLTLLEGSLNEPLLLHHDGQWQLMSNVCTHRGFILLDAPQPAGTIRCRYHGRCFEKDGTFKSMPMFEGAENFPTAMDNLRRAATANWNGLLFGAVAPDLDLAAILQRLQDRLYWFPFHQLQLRADLSKTYDVQAHWALYCENYLEGLHIPFVHQGLNKVLDFGQYETHIFDHCNLQLGIAGSKEPAFDLPADAPDYGKRVAAYYCWVFPNLMLNVYPWGISVNVVEPQGPDRTRVRFLTYVSDPELLGQGAGSDLDTVELEDEWVVERVHRGTASRLYHSGRYAPSMEQGVYHFHRLLRSRLY